MLLDFSISKMKRQVGLDFLVWFTVLPGHSELMLSARPQRGEQEREARFTFVAWEGYVILRY